jgi:hypothetical protein
MKNTLYLGKLMMIIGLLIFSSCKKDADNEKFAGTYNMLIGCGDPHIMTVTLEGEKGINLNNFGDNGQGWVLKATVSGNDITIPSQTFSDGSGDLYVSGSGSLSGNSITLQLSIEYSDYTNSANDYSLDCSTTGTK